MPTDTAGARCESGRTTFAAGWTTTTNSSSAGASRATRTTTCDRCHHTSFWKCGIYTLHTTDQFNMYNCTARRGHPREIRHPSPDSDKIAHRPATWRMTRAQKDRAGPGGVQRDRRRTLSLLWEARRGLGVGSVGAEPASLVAKGPGTAASWGTCRFCPVIQLFRPRCAAAGCPRAEREPRPRGNGGARRAFGSM